MNVLYVKLTSMGDLVHSLPALTDAVRAKPHVVFHSVNDEAFAEVLTWHPAVKRVIRSAHRRWRASWWRSWRSGELKAFFRELRETEYDLVIDGQTNLKAAAVTAMTRGIKSGLDRKSAREFGAHWVYQRKFSVPKGQHAIDRLRDLFSQALEYTKPTSPPDFGLDRTRFRPPELALPEKYLFFVHNASWGTKLWPEPYWEKLIDAAVRAGHSVLLPCGNAEEAARAMRLCRGRDGVQALPKMSLSEIAHIIAGATGAVCVDTGLGQLTGALEVPAVTLYGPTDSGLIGSAGQCQIHLQADFRCAPCYQQKCTYTGPAEQTPACYEKIPPELVWSSLQSIIK